jgi:hypothetical protein
VALRTQRSRWTIECGLGPGGSTPQHRLDVERDAGNQLCDDVADESTMTETRPPDVGDVAPDFTLPDATKTLRRLADLCAACPSVLVFYRGHW